MVLLGACATYQIPAGPGVIPDKNQPTFQLQWQARQHQLITKHLHWQLQAKIAIRSAKDSQSASLYWSQLDQANYRITLFGPLGGNRLQITGNTDQAMLRDAQGQVIGQGPIEHLLTEQTGWSVPVKGFGFWIRALVIPATPKKWIFDKQGRLQTLQQSGWHIQYLNYESVSGIAMPSRIQMQNDQILVKLAIKRWYFN